MRDTVTKLNKAPAYLLMMIILFADQLTKVLVRVNMDMYHSIPCWIKSLAKPLCLLMFTIPARLSASVFPAIW